MLYDLKINLVLKMYSGEYHVITSGFKACTEPLTEEKYNHLIATLLKVSAEQYGEPVDTYFPATEEQIAKLNCKNDYFYFTATEEAKIALAQMKDYYKKINHTLSILKRDKDGRPEEERQKHEEKFNEYSRLLADIDFVKLFLSNDMEDVNLESVEESLDNVIAHTSPTSRRNWNSVLTMLKTHL